MTQDVMSVHLREAFGLKSGHETDVGPSGAASAEALEDLAELDDLARLSEKLRRLRSGEVGSPRTVLHSSEDHMWVELHSE